MMALAAGQRFAIRWAKNVIRNKEYTRNRYPAEKYRYPGRNNIIGMDKNLFLNKSDRRPPPSPKKFPNVDDFTMLLVITSIGSLIYAR